MTVQCPSCSTSYALPDHLLGPRGARIRCPHCRETFVVLREAAAAAEALTIDAGATGALAADPGAPASDAPLDPEAMAVSLLDALALRLGDRLESARRRGRVLSELGPELLEVWDAFRDRLGADARPEVFRAVLRERWSVDLGPGLPERGSV